MTDVNLAKFTINGTASEDQYGNRGFVATNSQQLSVTLEVNPSSVISVLYEVYDPNDTDSPMASKDAPNLTWNGSGTAKQTFTSPNNTALVDMPASGAHSYIIRATVSTSSGSQYYERLVSILMTSTTPDLRKTLPAETVQFAQRSWSDDQNDIVEALDYLSAASFNMDATYNNFGANPAIVTIDNAQGQGDLRFNPVGAFSLVSDLSGCTGSADGFSIADGSDNFNLIHKGANLMDLDADLQAADIACSTTFSFSGTNASLTTGGQLSINGNLELTGGGSITTSSNGNLTLLPNGTGITIVGDAGTATYCAANDDILVTGVFEVLGSSYYFGSGRYRDNVELQFGNVADATLFYGTAQNPDSLILGVSADSNALIICENADRTYNFAHTLQTNPTLFIHSANQSTTEWLSLAHNQTSGVINWGTGSLLLSGGNVGIGATTASSLLDLQKAGTVKTVTDLLELTNTGNAADMDGTATSILFNQYYYDASTPAVVNSMRLQNNTIGDWTSTAGTQQSEFRLASLEAGNLLDTFCSTSIKLNDSEYYDLPSGRAGMLFLTWGNGAGYAWIKFTKEGAVTLITSAYVEGTDTGTSVAVFDNGSNVRIKNRNGNAVSITLLWQQCAGTQTVA